MDRTHILSPVGIFQQMDENVSGLVFFKLIILLHVSSLSPGVAIGENKWWKALGRFLSQALG